MRLIDAGNHRQGNGDRRPGLDLGPFLPVGNDAVSPLILKRASASRSPGQWRGDDYEMPTARPRMPSSNERFPAQFRQIERDHAGADCSCRATPQLATSRGDHDEEDAYLPIRGCDNRRRLGRDCDGCLRPVAGARMGWRMARGMEGWRMGTRSRGRGRRGCRDRRRDHCIPAAGLRRVPQLRPAGVRTRMLLGITAGVRRFGPRRRLYGAAGAGLPWLRPPAATDAGLCRTATGTAARCR